ncbi:unnamed protein product [Mytilus edulis]|uniref:Uncharacterized protein n=1 Tax=Mytilus edulis TaxID=6550 RepID=A0A8S3T7X3_MYTED|nr:unnamed protein product [Mytilus edulis]
MNSKINKQNERLINIQNQLNLSRSTISRLKDANSHLEKTVTDMSEKLCQSSKIHETNKNVIMELTNKVKSLDLEISTIKVQAEKSKSKLEATIKLCNETNRNIKVTFLRYFDKQYKRSAYAHLNVAAEDKALIKNPEFWPKGIFVKPWLPWEQFAAEHSIPVPDNKNHGYD